jgi:hypothetical protein
MICLHSLVSARSPPNSAEISRTASSIPAHRDRDSIIHVHYAIPSVAVFFLPEDKEAVVAIARSQMGSSCGDGLRYPMNASGALPPSIDSSVVESPGARWERDKRPGKIASLRACKSAELKKMRR